MKHWMYDHLWMPIWCAIVGATILSLVEPARAILVREGPRAWQSAVDYCWVLMMPMAVAALMAAVLIDQGKRRESRKCIVLGQRINATGAFILVSFVVLASFQNPTFMLINSGVVGAFGIVLAFLTRSRVVRELSRLGSLIQSRRRSANRNDSQATGATRTPIKEIWSDYKEEKASRQRTRVALALLLVAIIGSILLYSARRVVSLPIRKLLIR